MLRKIKVVICRKIPNISPKLMDIFKHNFRGLYSREAYIRGLYSLRAFCDSICVSRLQSLLSYQQNMDISVEKELSISQNKLYLPFKTVLIYLLYLPLLEDIVAETENGPIHYF